MERYALVQDDQGRWSVGEAPADAVETFGTREAAERRLLDSVPRRDMTPEAWAALTWLREAQSA